MRAFVNSSLALHSYFALYHNLRNLPPFGLSHFLPDKFSISAYLPLSLTIILSKEHACPQLHHQTFTPRYLRHSRTAFQITCSCERGLYPSECSFFTRASAYFRERNLVGKLDTAIWSDGNFERRKCLVGRRAKRTNVHSGTEVSSEIATRNEQWFSGLTEVGSLLVYDRTLVLCPAFYSTTLSAHFDFYLAP